MSRIKRWTLLGIVLVVAVMSGCKGIQEDETQEGANFYTLYHTALMAEDKVKMKELVSHNRKEVPKFVEDLLRASNAMMNLNMYTLSWSNGDRAHLGTSYTKTLGYYPDSRIYI